MAKLFAKKVPKKCSMNSKSAQMATIPPEISPKNRRCPRVSQKSTGDGSLIRRVSCPVPVIQDNSRPF